MLQPFSPIVGATWKANGKWKDGRPFKQEVEYRWGVGSQNVQVATKSYLDTSFTGFGAFSEGVHAWDNNNNQIRFWNFDMYGNIVEGKVLTKGKDITYVYNYKAEDGTEIAMTDMWKWVKEDKYMFKVGTMEDGEWKEVYLETYFFKK